MSSWATHRRRLYFEGALGIVALVVAVIWFFNLEKPTCFDGNRNQDEVGVDCGGSCAIFCPAQVLDPVVRWARTFEVTTGLYNAVAYVENRNPEAGTRRIPYIFKFFDADLGLIAERTGVAFIPPKSIVPIFEGSIATDRAPARTTFEFTNAAIWERASIDAGQALVVENSALIAEGETPGLAARVRNNSIYPAHDIGVVAVVYDAKRNAVAASRTVIDEIGKDQTQNVVFTWPRAFETRVEQCIVPVDVSVVMDTSGSMNEDSLNPPEPLSSAKRAAGTFIGGLGFDDRVSVVTFATHGSLVHPTTNEHKDALKALDKVVILPEEEQGFTNLGEGIAFARQALQDAKGTDTQRSRAIVLLTDGLANAPEEPGGEAFALTEAAKAKEAGIALYTIGLGGGVNRPFLTEIASRANQAYFTATSAGLAGIYEQISNTLCERGPAIIDIIPLASDLYFR